MNIQERLAEAVETGKSVSINSSRDIFNILEGNHQQSKGVKESLNQLVGREFDIHGNGFLIAEDVEFTEDFGFDSLTSINTQLKTSEITDKAINELGGRNPSGGLRDTTAPADVELSNLEIRPSQNQGEDQVFRPQPIEDIEMSSFSSKPLIIGVGLLLGLYALIRGLD